MGGGVQDTTKLKTDVKREIDRVTSDIINYLDMIKEAIDLATQQVTEQRIFLIEKALVRSYGLSDFFADLLIAIAATPLTAIVLKTVAKTFIERVLNTRYFFLNIEKDGTASIVETGFGGVLKRPFSLYLAETEILKEGSKNYDLWKITESLINPTTTAARTAAKDILKASRQQSYFGKFTSGTSPSVMFKNAVFSFRERQKSAQEKIQVDVKTKIDNDEYTESDLKDILDEWKSKPNITSGPEERNSLRPKYAKAFEALIWVLLCGGYGNMIGTRSNYNQMSQSMSYGII